MPFDDAIQALQETSAKDLQKKRKNAEDEDEPLSSKKKRVALQC
jgi:hypothetical protein